MPAYPNHSLAAGIKTRPELGIVLTEFGLLLLLTGYQFDDFVAAPLPWYAVLTAISPWLLFRWPINRAVPKETFLIVCLQALQVHAGGIALGFTAVSLLFGVPLTVLWPAAGSCLGLLVVSTCITVRPLRSALSDLGCRVRRIIWPELGAVLAPLIAVWLWDRFALPGTLPPSVYFWTAAGGMTGLWIACQARALWRNSLPAAMAVVPLMIALAGTPDGEPKARLALLVGLVTVASVLHAIGSISSAKSSGELIRLWLLALAALWLAEPLLTSDSNGAGDAQWYGLVLADAIEQWRGGVYPPFVGQSQFAFSGSSFPGCFAPYFQVFGVFLNFITGDILSVYALQHLTAALSLGGGIYAAYGVLVALAPNARVHAAMLAVLYGASPAWLGAIYSMDMYMTALTLPWLPFVFYGCVRTFVRLDRPALTWLIPPLSLVWHAHPPVALWTTLAVATTQCIRLVRWRRAWRIEWRWGLAAAGIFAVLTCLPFVSTYFAETHTDNFRHAEVVETLRTHWWAAWSPVSAGADRLTDQHLGWSLGLTGLAGGIFVWRLRRSVLAALFGATIGLVILLAPIPTVQDVLWQTLPSAIKSITNNWPTQRLYPVLAALVVVGAGGMTLRALRRRPLWARWVAAGLGVSLVWSFTEAAKFQRRGRVTTLDAETSARRLLPENIVLTRYAYEMFSRRPDYFAHGVMNPLIKNRLRAVDSLAVLDSNEAAASRTAPVREFSLNRVRGSAAGFGVTPPLSLLPDRQYLLEFEFVEKNLAGDFRIKSERLDRTYRLPDDGGVASFGSARNRAKSISLWTSGANAETVRWEFQPSRGDPPQVFAKVRVREIDSAKLPVKLDSLVPYRSTVRAPQPAWLVTPRMWLPGYAARVNGRSAEVGDSPQGLVMVLVPAGESKVELHYVGPWPVRFANWTSNFAWLGLLLSVVCHRLSKNPVWNAAVKQGTR